LTSDHFLSGHVDMPTLLRSLPATWRRRTVVPAAANYFDSQRLLASAVSLAFGSIPVERRGFDVDNGATAHITRLLAAGWSLVVYPEGTRSCDGTVDACARAPRRSPPKAAFRSCPFTSQGHPR
jgi:1-acyl-sn-glycerol-3-phosphate acyltransferase